VRAGRTQAFDDAVMHWVAAHRVPWLEEAMLEITFLGTGLVVVVMVGIAALFLWLTRHRYSAVLLLVATGGGILLNNVLKLGFARPRPTVFSWGTHVMTSSFPSGHAMSAAVVYGTVAYLAARLEHGRLARAVTLLAAGVLILLICASRLYLGVHYPSDIIAGIVVGVAWAGFCMAMLEVAQRFGRRHAPGEIAADEKPPAEPTPLSPPREPADAGPPPTAFASGTRPRPRE
jgi:undecaprenyl-diphosphatase